MGFTALRHASGPRYLSATVLSPTSIHLTWVAPCHTQQCQIYYRGTCGTHVDEGSFDTNHQEYTVDGLQVDMNYSFTVNQSGFSGGEVLSTGPVYARTFTAGMLDDVTLMIHGKLFTRWSKAQHLHILSSLRSSTVNGSHVCTTH